jgi:hypothetical protein
METGIPERIVEQLMPGIIGQSFKLAFDEQQAEEFVAEALLAISKAYTRYSHKSDDELVKLLGRTATNRMLDCKRHAAFVSKQRFIEIDENMAYMPHTYDALLDVCGTVSKMLNALPYAARVVFLERLEPSPKTQLLLNRLKAEKECQRQRGFFTMGKVTMSNGVLVKATGLTARQVAQANKEIRETYSRLVNGGNNDGR